jgi:hypothetical protein
MRRRDTYWSLFHKIEKRQIDDLKTDAVEVVYEVIPSKDRGDWLVWREGFATWKPLEDFPTLLQSLRKGGMLSAPSQPAPAPAQRDVPTKIADSSTSKSSKDRVAKGGPRNASTADETKSVAARKETTVQDRLARQGSLESEVDFDLLAETEALGDRAARYRKKWQIRILTEGKPFMNTTVDASNRGFSLKDPLPKGLPRYFNVEVFAGEMVIPLICSEVPSKSGASTRLRIEVNHNPSLLQAALLQ